jgi:hypothetical protein
MEHRSKQNGIWSWYRLVTHCKTDGNRNSKGKKLENAITTVFQRHCKSELFICIQDFKGVFTKFISLGQMKWNDDEVKKRRFVQNAQNIGLVDMGFEEFVISHSQKNSTFLDHMP